MTKNKIGILSIGLLLVVVLLVTLLYNPKSPGSEEFGTSSMVLPQNAHVNVYPIDSMSWAYEIIIDDQIFIFQETIPGIPNKKLFKNKANAKSCGELVLKKLKANKIPSITKDELDSLGVAY